MLTTTAGRLWSSHGLPPAFRDPTLRLDAKGVSALLDRVARESPEQYPAVVKHLTDVGKTIAYRTGGYSFGLNALKRPAAAVLLEQKLQPQLDAVYARTDLTAEQKREAATDLLAGAQKTLEKDVMAEAERDNNPLAMQVLSGSRGKPSTLQTLIAGDLMYQDSRGRPIPVPVFRSYAQGLSPAQYMAGAYGARTGVVGTKLSTASAGFLGKQLTNASHRLVVGRLDHDEAQHGPDPNRMRGLPVDTADRDNVGALLARDTAGYPRNTVLTDKLLRHLQDAGHTRILVRSPLASQSADGTIYGRDVGVRERGGIPAAGDQVGIAAAQAVGEVVSQTSLGSKHCLAIGTLVRMADGSAKPIEEIRVGDRVLGADRTGRAFPIYVVNTFDNGLRDCVRTEFAVAMTKERIELVCTLDHKLLGTKYQWALPHQLKEDGVFPLGQKCTKMTYRMVTAVDNEFGTVDEPYALLLGLLIGDGCYRKSVGGVYLSCFDPTLVSDVQAELDGFGLKLRLCAGQKGYYRIGLIKDEIRQDPATGRTLPGDRNPVKVYLKESGMWDKYAHDKQLPPGYETWTNRSVFRLLAGFLATDGSVYDQVGPGDDRRTFVNFGSTSLRMLEQVKELLQVRLGIHCGPIKTNNYGGRKRPMYSLNIHRYGDVRRFAAATVEYTPGVKKDRLRALLDSTATSSRDFSRFYKKRQTPAGSVSTYDIEVDHPDHLFVLANGLIVSNSGGVSKGKAVGPTGFKLISQLTQAPKESPFWAAHAGEDGVVRSIEPSPAGGSIVKVNGLEHHAPPGADVLVKPGDRVEAGDPLSSGVPNPNELVRHLGVGEGRRKFLEAFRHAVGPGQIDRRNLELVTRGLVNHVRLTDAHGDWVPDDVVPYDVLERRWEPREGSISLNPDQAVGRHLEEPVLHYSIGTKVRPSVVKELKHFGVPSVLTHPDPPPFEPHFVRGMENLGGDQDWMVRQVGSNLQKSTLKAVHRGEESDENSTSFVPSLARGKDFGKAGPVKSPVLSEVTKV